MPNILDIRRRIRSVTNTRQITKAMKMVSAAKLRRAQERALAARPYAQMLTNVLKSLVSRAEVYDPETGEPRHPLLARRPEKNVLLIVVTGDKGLAGAFNTNILKAAARFIATKADKNLEIENIGRKGRDFFKRRGFEVRIEEIGIFQKVRYADAQRIARAAIEEFSRSGPPKEPLWSDFAKHLSYVSGTFDDPAGFHRLREKLDRPFEKKMLHTVRGVGYVLR